MSGSRSPLRLTQRCVPVKSTLHRFIRERLAEHRGRARPGLEHLDERYVKAVGYATKAKRHGRPKMVLLGDIVDDDENAVARAASDVVRIANARGAEGFIAVSAESRKKFWLDRARTAAIAKHTNAFKINEDVVIPLARIGEYTDGIERINIELSIKNKLALCEAMLAFFSMPSQDILDAKMDEARTLIAAVRDRWRQLRNDIDETFPALQDHSIVVFWKTEIKTPIEEIFAGLACSAIRKRIAEIHKEILHGRVFVALHMHAGDGNVHTNIPVNSDDYDMLNEARAAVTRIMAMARKLDGVISGEHGIGITKIFPGCRLLDIHEYLLEKNVRLEGVEGVRSCITTRATRR